MTSRTHPRRALFVGANAGALVSAFVLLLSSCKTTPYEYSVTPHEYSGVRLYQVFCSSCHGLTGHGDGPVESLFRGGVPDLTGISERNGGKFPRQRVHEIIDGRESLIAHGTSSMPVWGFEFYEGTGGDREARKQTDAMIDRLVDYLKSLQAGYYD
jgi:mono/diheme cytochrome c family protein